MAAHFSARSCPASGGQNTTASCRQVKGRTRAESFRSSAPDKNAPLEEENGPTRADGPAAAPAMRRRGGRDAKPSGARRTEGLARKQAGTPGPPRRRIFARATKARLRAAHRDRAEGGGGDPGAEGGQQTAAPGGGPTTERLQARAFKTKAGKGRRPQGRRPAVPPTTDPMRRPGYPAGRPYRAERRKNQPPTRRTRDGGHKDDGPPTTDAPGKSGTRGRRVLAAAPAAPMWCSLGGRAACVVERSTALPSAQLC